MWRETENQEGGRSSRRLHIFAGRQAHDGSHGERFEHRFAGSDHADGARHAASPSAAPAPHSWHPDTAAAAWQANTAMPPVYEPPPEPSAWWESLKMLVIMSLTIGGTLYGVYVLNTYLDAQHKEIPVYGDTAAPPPGRGTGPPAITWGGAAKH